MQLQTSIIRIFIIIGFVLVSTFWVQYDIPAYLPSLNSFNTELSGENVNDIQQISWGKSQSNSQGVSNNNTPFIRLEFQVEDHSLESSEQYHNYLNSNKKVAFAFYYSILKDIS